MNLLLLGGSGQVGTELRALAAAKNIALTAPERSELDLVDVSAIARVIAAAPWSAVINAAAFTDVDRAERDEAMAFAVNAEAPLLLAAETARRGIPLVHISTDYVFDGKKGAPYVESDPTGPINLYGRSKLEGDLGVCAGNPQHVVLRTSWVYSPYGRNFVKTILRLAGERERLTVVDDQRGSPTAARDIARACLGVATRCASGPARVPYGIYHFAGAGEATWFEFAGAIIAFAGDRLARVPSLAPIRTSDYPTPALRAADTRLDCNAIARAFGLVPRPWREALKDTIDQLLTHRTIA